jgi:hypothetical protein
MADHPVPAPARELNDEEHKSLVDQVFSYEQAVKQALAQGRHALWQLAEALYHFNEDRGWLVLGHDNLSDWLSDPEIGMPRSTYHRLVRVWGDFVVARDIETTSLTQLDPSKVDLVLPALKAGTATTKKAINDVESLGWRDLRERYAPPKESVPEPKGDEDEAGWEGVNGTAQEDHEAPPSSNGDQVEDAPVEVATDTVVMDAPDPAPWALTYDLAHVMFRVQVEVAPPEKKRMSGELRQEVNRVVQASLDAGLLADAGLNA